MDFERLYFLIESNDLTQSEMGKLVNTTKVSICNWEKGKEIIPLNKLNFYSNYFNVSMDYILKLTDEKVSINKIDTLNKKLIGNNIKKIRIQNKLSQRDLANILNTSCSNICYYETGKNLILTAFAYELCKYFNVSMDWLCGKEKNT